MTALGGSAISIELDDSMLAFVEQRTTFQRAALIGDTITPRFEVTSIEPKRGEKAIVRIRVTVINSDGERLLDGEHVYLIKGRGWRAPA